VHSRTSSTRKRPWLVLCIFYRHNPALKGKLKTTTTTTTTTINTKNPLSLLTSEYSFRMLSLWLLRSSVPSGEERDSYFSCIEWTHTSLHIWACFFLFVCSVLCFVFTNYMPEESSVSFWVINLPLSDSQWSPNLGELWKQCRFLTYSFGLPRSCLFFFFKFTWVHQPEVENIMTSFWHVLAWFEHPWNGIILLLCLGSLDLLICCLRPSGRGNKRLIPHSLSHQKAKCVMC